MEKTHNQKSKFNLNDQKGKVQLEDLEPSLMKEVRVFSIKSKEDLTKEMIKQILIEDVAVLRGFCWAFGISKDPFDTDLLKRQHGEELVDVVE